MSGEGVIVEEEYLVYAELCDNTDPNIFSHAETSFKSYALDTDQPILTIGGQAFAGKYRDTVGTAVFLEEIPPGSEEQIGFGDEPSDPLFVDSPSQKLKYVYHTRKSLEMSRVLLLEKKKDIQDLENVEENKDCFATGESAISGEEQKDENLGLVEELTKLSEEPHNIVERDVMELKSEVLDSLEEGQMIKNIENIKIINHSDGSTIK